MNLVCYVISQDHIFKVIGYYGQDPIKVSYHPANLAAIGTLKVEMSFKSNPLEITLCQICWSYILCK